jgi:hypothetical protein
MDAIAETTLEPIAVQQRHEQLKILFLAVVRRGRHQQEMARQGGKELSELVTLGIADLAAKRPGRHLVRFVADDQVPPAVRCLELLLNVLITRKLIEPGNHQIGFQEPVAGASSLQLVVGQNFERQVEAAIEFVLPLLGEAAGANDKASVEIAARDQLLHEQASHDRFAGARVVRKEKAQWLAR